MTISSTLEKTRKDLEKTFSDPTPLYVLAGAADFAAEKLRGLSSELTAYAAKLDANNIKDQAQAAQAGVTNRVGSLQSDIQAAPAQAKELPAKLQAAAGDAAATVLSGAVATYGDFVERGETLVTRVRKQKASQDLDDQLDATVSKVKAASTTAKKSASSTKKTAKKSAASTKSATKAAVTSAKKSAAKAVDAAEAAAEKTGDKANN